jgi:hypothetical protein
MASQNNKPEIEMSNLEDYDTLYKVDLNFDSDVTKLDPQVITDYIVRVLAGHPYYISVNNIVDVIANEGSKTVTVVVSTKEVQEKIVDITNNDISLDEINRNNTVVDNQNNQKRLNLISANLTSKKFIMETKNPNGEPIMYEYDFKGFKSSKNLFLEKTVELNGNKKRHFLRNNNNNPYFYDEFMNSEIVYSSENSNGNNPSPNNVNGVRNMMEEASISEQNIPVANINVINNNINLTTAALVNNNPNGITTNVNNPNVNNNSTRNVNVNNNSTQNVNVNNSTRNVNDSTQNVNVNNNNNSTRNVNDSTQNVNDSTQNVNDSTQNVNVNNQNGITTNVNNQNVNNNEYQLNDELNKELDEVLNNIETQDTSPNYTKWIIIFLVIVLLIVLFVLIFEIIDKKKTNNVN